MSRGGLSKAGGSPHLRNKLLHTGGIMEWFLKDLRDANIDRCTRWHGSMGVHAWSPAMWGLAAAGEMGECCNAIKKLVREQEGIQSQAVNATPAALVKQIGLEIGDTVVYLDLLAASLGLNLEDCIRDTFNRVSIREGFPERL